MGCCSLLHPLCVLCANLAHRSRARDTLQMLRERERSLEGELRDLKAKEQPLRQQVQEKIKQNNRYSFSF